MSIIIGNKANKALENLASLDPENQRISEDLQVVVNKTDAYKRKVFGKRKKRPEFDLRKVGSSVSDLFKIDHEDRAQIEGLDKAKLKQIKRNCEKMADLFSQRLREKGQEAIDTTKGDHHAYMGLKGVAREVQQILAERKGLWYQPYC